MARKGSPMKRALMIAVGCALLAGPGYALDQSPPPGPDRDDGRMAWRDGGWDRDGREGWRRDDRDRDDRRAYRDDPRGPDEGWHHGRSEGHHRRGAQFWLRSGEPRLGVQWPPERADARLRGCGHDVAGQSPLPGD